MSVKDTAIKLLQQGISVIPVNDGAGFAGRAKTPLCKWQQYYEQPMTPEEYSVKWEHAKAIAIAPTKSDGIECLDFDLKNYPKGRDIFSEYISELQEKAPTLFRRLYIESTAGGGHHIVFKCYGKRQEQAAKKFAFNYALIKDANPRIDQLAMIENKVHQGYFIIAPSVLHNYGSYDVVQGNIFDLQVISEEERQMLHDLAESFEMGDKRKELDERIKEYNLNVELSNPDSGTVKKAKGGHGSVFAEFNEKEDPLKYLLQYGFTVVKETADKVHLLRQGDTTSPHSGYYYKDSGVAMMFSTSTPFEAGRAITAADAFMVLNGLNLSDGQGGAALLREHGFGRGGLYEAAEFETEKGFKYLKFWRLKKGKTKLEITIQTEWLTDYLNYLGYRRHYLTQGERPEYRRVKDGVIYPVEPSQIKEEVLTLFDGAEDNIDYIGEWKLTKADFKDWLRKQDRNFLLSVASVRILDTDKILKENIDVSFLFFKNTAVKIKPDGITLIPYDEMKGLVWHEQIIEHKLNYVEDGGSWEKFMKNCIAFEENYPTLQAAYGYLLHNYQQGVRKAIVLTDRFSTADTSNGRTGKSLFAKGLSKLVSSCTIPAKNWKPDKNFAFQAVDYSNSLVILNDIDKGMNLESLYNIITDSLHVEKKGKQSFSKHVKLLVTTNHLFLAEGSSSEARLLEIEFGDHYNIKHTPYDDSGFWFFTDNMPQHEWDCFYSYSIRCLQYHLQKLKENPSAGGLELNKKVSEQHIEKQLEASVGKNIIEFMDNHFNAEEGFINLPFTRAGHGKLKNDKAGIVYDPDQLMKHYKDQYRSNITKISFVRKLKRYFDLLKIEVETGYRMRDDKGHQRRYLMVHISELDKFKETDIFESKTSEIDPKTGTI